MDTDKLSTHGPPKGNIATASSGKDRNATSRAVDALKDEVSEGRAHSPGGALGCLSPTVATAEHPV